MINVKAITDAPIKAYVKRTDTAHAAAGNNTIITEGRSPYISDGMTWVVWDTSINSWRDTGIRAEGQPGRDGADGLPGRDGRDGVDGLPGRDGRDGLDGADGAPGRDGVDGAPGRDGRDGDDYVLTEDDKQEIAQISKEPQLSRMYTGVWNTSPNKASNQSANYTEWFIGAAQIQDPISEWSVKYSVESWMPNWTKETIERLGISGVTVYGEDKAFGYCKATIEHKGCGNKWRNSIVDVTQYDTSYRAQYYAPYAYPADVTADPFLFGYGIYRGYQYYRNNANDFDAYAEAFGRTVKVEILDAKNCTVSLFEKDSWINYTTALSGYTVSNIGIITNGRTQTGDVNTVSRLLDTISGNMVKADASYGIIGYGIHMFNANGELSPMVTTRGTGTAKAKNANGFALYMGGPWFYATGTSVTAGGWAGNYLYKPYENVDMRYSFNVTKENVPLGSKVFIKGAIHDDGFFYLDDDWFATSLPQEEDGCVYVFLGVSSGSTWYHLEFWSEHPALQFKDGRIQRLY